MVSVSQHRDKAQPVKTIEMILVENRMGIETYLVFLCLQAEVTFEFVVLIVRLSVGITHNCFLNTALVIKIKGPTRSRLLRW